MYSVAIQVIRFVDAAFPGWVECELVDAEGRRHVIKDKVPMFTVEELDADSRYPAEGCVPCEVLERYKDRAGQELARITTKEPYGIESSEGLTEFIVPASCITSVAD
jgi:hypothetical protein